MPDAPDIPAETYTRIRIALTGLRVYRVAAGLTQQELAMRASRSRATIGALERHENAPQLAMAQALAEALGTDVESLFPNDDGPEANPGRVEESARQGRRVEP